jgi:hypothetical protein
MVLQPILSTLLILLLVLYPVTLVLQHILLVLFPILIILFSRSCMPAPAVPDGHCHGHFPWKIGAHESGCEPCSQTSMYDIPATAGKQAIVGMLALARIPAATGMPALSKGHKQEKPQPQQQKRHQQQNLCGKAVIKMAGN